MNTTQQCDFCKNDMKGQQRPYHAGCYAEAVSCFKRFSEFRAQRTSDTSISDAVIRAEFDSREAITQIEAVLKGETPEPQVAGVYMDRSIADFKRAVNVLIAEEQEKLAQNNALIAVLCDSIRLTRELVLKGEK